jgi:hypothetical protein
MIVSEEKNGEPVTLPNGFRTTYNLAGIPSFLNSWPYDPDDNVWVGLGAHGRDIMLVRQPMGLEAYELEGRPDGQRPHGMETELDFQVARALSVKARPEEMFRLNSDDCGRLFFEAAIYHGRANAFFRLKDWRRLEQDTFRTLSICDFVERYASSVEDHKRFQELRRSIIRMNAVVHEIILKERNRNEDPPKVFPDIIALQKSPTNGASHLSQFADVALSVWALRSRQPVIERDEALFIHQGDYWTISYQGNHTILKTTRGLRCLSCLLRHPGREFHVRELIAFLAESPVTSSLGETDAILDSKAKAEYKLRLDELRSDLQEAERFGDDYRVAKTRAEIDLLAQQLATAVGLGGRDRRAPSDSERARSAVTKRIREAITRIGTAIPTLARHLAAHVKTGYYCSYNPDPDRVPAWKF